MHQAEQFRLARTPIATGTDLQYAEQGDPAGEPVVLLHGWPDSWFSFSRVLSSLPATHHAYAVDQRGFGDSERPACCYAIDDLAADVVAFLDAVDLGRASLVGHSLGTFVARRVAETYPERVGRLALIGTGWSTVNEVLLEVAGQLRDLKDPVPAAFAQEFQAGTVFLPPPGEFFAGIIAESLKLPARLWREVFDGLLAFDDRADLERISAPTLILWGERDPIFPRADQDRVVAAIPNARLLVYPDTGHCPNWERPERVAADLDTFLRETLPESPPTARS